MFEYRDLTISEVISALSAYDTKAANKLQSIQHNKAIIPILAINPDRKFGNGRSDYLSSMFTFNDQPEGHYYWERINSDFTESLSLENWHKARSRKKIPMYYYSIDAAKTIMSMCTAYIFDEISLETFISNLRIFADALETDSELEKWETWYTWYNTDR